MDALDSLVDSRTGVPNDPKMARLVIAAKYALAHKVLFWSARSCTSLLWASRPRSSWK